MRQVSSGWLVLETVDAEMIGGYRTQAADVLGDHRGRGRAEAPRCDVVGDAVAVARRIREGSSRTFVHSQPDQHAWLVASKRGVIFGLDLGRSAGSIPYAQIVHATAVITLGASGLPNASSPPESPKLALVEPASTPLV